MKVLFIGEGRHDIGPASFAPQPREAVGVVPILARKICPQISRDSVALTWREVSLFSPAKKKGLANKLVAAAIIASKRGCHATVGVIDQDREASRLQELRRRTASYYILARIADIDNRQDSEEFRREIAEQTKPQELEENSPDGFGAFASDLRQNLCKSV